MRIVCIGGGPAGLYFGLLMKKLRPEHAVTVIERNKPYDTFGWGVVFSDAMMSAMRAADPESAAEIADAFNHWDDIELVFKGSRQRTTGHGFIGIGRKQLLNILQRRCEALGVELAFEHDVNSDLEFPDADLIVAADGFNSKIRHRYADQFLPDLLVRPNRYIWLGVAKAFDAFTFDFRKTEHGWFQAHIYKFDREHIDLHRRNHPGRLRGAWARRTRPGRLDRLLRGGFRRDPRWREAHDQCAPFARFALA